MPQLRQPLNRLQLRQVRRDCN